MQVKMFEVLDKATFLPCVGILCESNDINEQYLLRRMGYGKNRCILFGPLGGGLFTSDVNDHRSNRTLINAHEYILEYWDTLVSGDVIDVEFILGYTAYSKLSEREG